MSKGDGKGRPKDLRLVKPKEVVEPRDLDDATDALRAAVAPPELDTLDHEALLALTLGDEVSEIGDAERDAADALRAALAGDGDDDGGLVELAMALRSAHAGAEDVDVTLAQEDNEALIALALSTDGAELDRGDVDALRRALEGGGHHPLADLADTLRAARGAALEAADQEVLLALTLGDETADLEIAGAERLRDALAGQGSHSLMATVDALRAGIGEPALSRDDGRLLVAMTTGEDAVVSSSEREQAEALRAAMEERTSHPLAAVASMLRATAGQLPEIDQVSNERLVRGALERAVESARDELTAREGEPPAGRVTSFDRRTRQGALIGAIVALAAGFALFFGSLKWLETRQGPVARGPRLTAVDAELITTRSTTELFDPLEKFPTKGGESERMRKIVSSRAADLRANRFARWGVK